MENNKYAIYIRVSTQRQGVSMLGMEAQESMCMQYINSQKGELIAKFQDVESGKKRDRKGLMDAIDFCKENGCTLVIATLSRLARDVEFTFKVINTGISIYFCDMPSVNTLILGVMASVAQYERELISKRTKDALAAKKARNEKMGGHNELWGKGTGANREAVLHIVRGTSAERRRDNARNNDNNRFFWAFITKWIERYGEPKKSGDWAAVSTELNGLGQCTATGMKYTAIRAAAMYRKLKRIMN